MTHSITCTLGEGYAITASDDMGHHMTMDLSEKSGGKGEGFLPMPVMLVSLGGCLSADVKFILNRMRCRVDALDMEVSGDIDDSATPRVYKRIDIRLRVAGDMSEKQLERALELAEEKYCNVSAMLRQVVEIHTQIELITGNEE